MLHQMNSHKCWLSIDSFDIYCLKECSGATDYLVDNWETRNISDLVSENLLFSQKKKSYKNALKCNGELYTNLKKILCML